MANYLATARSNYFRVKDAAKFKEEMSKYAAEVEVVERDDFFAVLAKESDWPSYEYNEDEDDYEDVDFFGIVADHLIDDEVAVFMAAGAEKYRYIIGIATAINNRQEVRTVSLNDIYDKAVELTTNKNSITTAEY